MIEIFRAVDDERGIDGLPGLRGARSPRQHAHSLLARKRERVLGFFYRARGDDAERHDLVVRGVGGVAPARERVELHLAQEMRLEPPLEPRYDRWGHCSSLALFRGMDRPIPQPSCAGLTRASILFRKRDGSRRNSGMPEFRDIKSPQVG